MHEDSLAAGGVTVWPSNATATQLQRKVPIPLLRKFHGIGCLQGYSMHVSGVQYRLVGTGEQCAATDMIRGGKWWCRCQVRGSSPPPGRVTAHARTFSPDFSP